MDIEKSVSNTLRGVIRYLEGLILKLVHFIFLPLALSRPLFKLAIFFSLIPPLLFLSLSASIALQAWVPVGWSEIVLFQYG